MFAHIKFTPNDFFLHVNDLSFAITVGIHIIYFIQSNLSHLKCYET